MKHEESSPLLGFRSVDHTIDDDDDDKKVFGCDDYGWQCMLV